MLNAGAAVLAEKAQCFGAWQLEVRDGLWLGVCGAMGWLHRGCTGIVENTWKLLLMVYCFKPMPIHILLPSFSLSPLSALSSLSLSLSLSLYLSLSLSISLSLSLSRSLFPCVSPN